MPKISELPPVGGVNTVDTLPLVQAGTTAKATFAQLPISTAVQAALDTKVNTSAVGTIASQNANNVSITGGSVTGITDLAVADGGTGASTAAQARTNLGATSVGSAVFTATDAATARAALGSYPLIGVQRFTANGTYTPTAGTRAILVELVGGGGGGGGAATTGASQYSAGAGGGAGGYASSFLTSGFSGTAVTVGAGGAGNAGASGTVGGTTSFGALLSASGGAGGVAGGSITLTAFTDIQTVYGGNGGSGTNGNIRNAVGGVGGTAIYLVRPVGGNGGDSAFGGGPVGTANSPAPGTSGTSPGSGGSGTGHGPSIGNFAGGSGANGLVIVYEYG